MNTYQKEQLDALYQVRNALVKMGIKAKNRLTKEIRPYLKFRGELERFLDEHLGAYCTQTCYKSQMSACCSKDGIITFWADVVINACCSMNEELEGLFSAIKKPYYGKKCIYLGPKGCLWKVRPLVCAMFVCDQLQSDVIDQDVTLKKSWDQYLQQAKGFRWPDRPVLFDRLEEIFIDLGCQSPLMYINASPGLMRIKKRAKGFYGAAENRKSQAE